MPQSTVTEKTIPPLPAARAAMLRSRHRAKDDGAQLLSGAVLQSMLQTVTQALLQSLLATRSVITTRPFLMSLRRLALTIL